MAAVTAIILGFVAYNGLEAVTGKWSLPDYNPPLTPKSARQVIAFFAIVQGFEASRYMGKLYGAKRRIRTMKKAQVIGGIATVLFPASALLLFAKVRPQMEPAAVVEIAKLASPVLPWLILLLAAGSQTSASINAMTSRSEVLVELWKGKVARKYTYPILAIGAIVIVLVTDVTSAVAAASRVFAAYYTLQCALAVLVAGRRRKRRKRRNQRIGAILVGLAMLSITIFGISS